MDKASVLKAVITHLESTLERHKAAHQEASESAVDVENRAESKWDTGGLEASYLARGYAQQFEQTVKDLDMLKGFAPEDLSGRAIRLGALVQTELNGFRDWLLLLPCCGGLELPVNGVEVTVITLDSPLAHQLLNKAEGSTYRSPAGSSGQVLKVL